MTKQTSVDAASLHPIVHTPGPWVVRNHHNQGCSVIGCDAWLGSSSSRTNEQNLANARLIAAAPELLAACELVELWMRGGQPGPHSDSIVLEQVKLAIQKARS